MEETTKIKHSRIALFSIKVIKKPVQIELTFLVAGTGFISHCLRQRKMSQKKRLYYKPDLIFRSFLCRFQFLKRAWEFHLQKNQILSYLVCSSGNWTRTSDLRVMSPTSYLLLYPAMWTAKIRPFYILHNLFYKKYLLFYVLY